MKNTKFVGRLKTIAVLTTFTSRRRPALLRRANFLLSQKNVNSYGMIEKLLLEDVASLVTGPEGPIRSADRSSNRSSRTLD